MRTPARRPAWAAPTRAAACAAVVGALLCAPLAPAGADGPRYVAHPPVEGLRVVLDDVAPTVPRTGEEIVLRGRVVNGSGSQQRVGHVSVEASWSQLTGRGGVAEWVSGEAGLSTEWLLGVDAVGPVVAVGSEVPFTVRVPADALEGLAEDRTVLALEIHAHDEEDGPPGLVTTAPATLRTVLTVDGGGEVATPLSASWLVPLTLPPDPGLVSADDEVWRTAWEGAVGEGSAARTWVDSFTVPGVTWVVDPDLLAPVRREPLSAAGPEGTETEEEEETGEGTDEGTGQPTEEETDGATDGGDATSGPEDTATPTGSGAVATVAPPTQDDPGDDGAGSTSEPGGPAGPTDDAGSTEDPGPTDDAGSTDPGSGDDADDPTEEPTVPTTVEEDVAAEVATLAGQLAEAEDDQLWWLPPSDPDLAALLTGSADGGVLPELLAVPPHEPEGQATLLDRGRDDVAWPLLPSASVVDLDRLAAAWPATGSTLTAVVLPREALTGSSTAPVSSAVLPLVAPEGLDVVATDSRATSLLAGAGDEVDHHGTGAAVQHLLADTLAAWRQDPGTPRSLAVAPPRGTALPSALLQELSDGVRTAPWLSAAPLALTSSTVAAPPPTSLTGRGPDAEELGGPTAYLDPGASPLDAAALRSLASLRGTLDGLREVLVGTTAVDTWERSLTHAWSTRWRRDPQGWDGSWRPVRAASAEARAALHVNPGTVNFLADQGIMRVTIVNTLPVAVEDVRVRLVSSSSILQVVDQPDPIAIGPDSRATVSFSARAVTRGQTTVTAQLTAPNGTALGDNAPVEVRVQPTGVWIYWVLGGVAGVVLALGLARALRSTPRAVLAGTRAPAAKGADGAAAPTTTTGPA